MHGVWILNRIVVDTAVSINICMKDHLVDLGVLQLLPQVGHDVPQLKHGDTSEIVNIINTRSYQMPHLQSNLQSTFVI